MAMCLGTLRQSIRHHEDPVAVLEDVNKRIIHRSRDDRFVTAFLGVLDADTGRLRYASAGHNAPICYRAAEDVVETLPTHGLALGILPELGTREFETELKPGDTLVLFTDGVTEAQNAAHELFGEDRLEVAAGAGAATAEQAQQNVLQAIRDFTQGCLPSDDVTLLVARRTTSGPAGDLPGAAN
jgi:sigma-B regulation protein RsbU (phosphoserine phosphatase)